MDWQPHAMTKSRKRKRQSPAAPSSAPTASASSESSSDSLTCPICISIMIKPVRMPCQHELCLDCFKGSTTWSSLACPFCRRRLSIWMRRAKEPEALINAEKWNRIQREYPDYCQSRLIQQRLESDLSTVDEMEEAASVEAEILLTGGRQSPKHQLAQPGELASEWKAAVDAFNSERRAELEAEEAASLALIRQIEAEQQQQQQPKKKKTTSTWLDNFLARGGNNSKEEAEAEATEAVAVADDEADAENLAAPPIRREESLGQPVAKAEAYFLRCDSVDSIGPELNHFRPIQAMPLTPPTSKRLLHPKVKRSGVGGSRRRSVKENRRLLRRSVSVHSVQSVQSVQSQQASQSRRRPPQRQQSSVLEYACHLPPTVADAAAGQIDLDRDFALKLQRQFDRERLARGIGSD